ncbi:hypothetical protein HK102_007116, partial [Quaeritorhiza haematococci]
MLTTDENPAAPAMTTHTHPTDNNATTTTLLSSGVNASIPQSFAMPSRSTITTDPVHHNNVPSLDDLPGDDEGCIDLAAIDESGPLVALPASSHPDVTFTPTKFNNTIKSMSNPSGSVPLRSDDLMLDDIVSGMHTMAIDSAQRRNSLGGDRMVFSPIASAAERHSRRQSLALFAELEE